jgi:hypothetical protein
MRHLVTLEIQDKTTGRFETITELVGLSVSDLYSLYGLHKDDHFVAVELSESDFDFLVHSFIHFPKPDFSKKRVVIDVSAAGEDEDIN